jgi:7,8-dihydro-6-hydroxymethylpterin-pyrophosphokinase
MKVFNHQALVHFATDLVGGTPLARSLVIELNKIGQILAFSSVYKRYLATNRADLNAKIEAVFRIGTDCAADELLWHFRRFIKDKKTLLNLLSYDDLVVLSPQLTLPHPSLHTDFLIIRCASEVWPQFEHPIMEKTLSEISSLALPAVDVEFFLQGKSLVDF